MRYDDWDVILFPTGRDSKVPFKEFKVACQVVPDPELAHIHGSVGMPVMTCFVPSLPAGAPFQLSVHSWHDPEISQFTRTYSKHPELIKFEMRILLDGRLVASTVFDRHVNGPHLITSTFEFTKTGEHEQLKFPHFRRELLYQNHWNPGDDIGRIKVIISEGFPRDSLSVPIERVKNVVAFSFQHAPLEILEQNGIAWPNQAMWRRNPPLNPGLPVTVPTFRPEDGAESHSHSPRRRSAAAVLRNTKSQGFPVPHTGSFGSPAFQPPYCFPRTNTGSGNSTLPPDPFMDSTAYLEWVAWMANSQSSNSMGRQTDSTGRISWQMDRNPSKQRSDISMPDYSNDGGSHDSNRMHISGPSLEDEHPMSMKVPTNTPTTAEQIHGACNTQFQALSQHGPYFPANLATSLTQSLLNQPLPFPIQIPTQSHNAPTAGGNVIQAPASEVKSRKEALHLGLLDPNTLSNHTTPDVDRIGATRKFSQPLFTLERTESPTLDPLSSDASESAREKSQPAFSNSSRDTSAGDFSVHISDLKTGAATGSTTLGDQENVIPGNTICPSSSGTAGGGTKRTRTFTPASARAIDEEDEPRRASPHVRITGYGVGAVGETC
ncbi:hypothetical protein QBC35DRAFT_512018 [Podospora australis]|uniref:Uncharacterized protein n=1 Tax=Podospora australis TaxID=1536484 RepID=A0AAN7AM92_9PEZI|nr:hypothetical protein QBC35DRAFT_512018 [Podospora australis]